MHNGNHAIYFNNKRHGDDNYLVKFLGGDSVLDAVFDGVSTGIKGSIASKLTKDRLRDASRIRGPDDVKKLLESAHKALFERYKGRCTTTVAVGLKIGDKYYVVNVGDSPVYLFRDGKAEEIVTLDKFPNNLRPDIVLQVIGKKGETGKTPAEIEYHTREIDLQPEDRIILATDGVTDNASPDEFNWLVDGVPNSALAVVCLEFKSFFLRHKDEGFVFGDFKRDDQTAIARFFRD